MVLPYIVFTTIVLAILGLDLGVLGRRAHTPSVREAAAWSAVWIAFAALVAAWLFWTRGRAPGLEFVTGYVIEYSLSVDNIFVIVLIFGFFRIESTYQHRVLFWGIIGAIIMRAVMIFAGVALIERFEWITYVFGAFLLYTGIRMGTAADVSVDPGTNPVTRFVHRFVPVCATYDGEKFFIVGTDTRGIVRRMATPLFVVLVLIEAMDLVFAVDSIPAVFGVTREPFIVFSSNIAAVLGLRSLYFLLAGAVERFRYLKPALAIVLAFVGAKMLVAHWIELPTWASLAVIFVVLGSAAALSVRADRRRAPASR